MVLNTNNREDAVRIAAWVRLGLKVECRWKMYVPRSNPETAWVKLDFCDADTVNKIRDDYFSYLEFRLLP